MTRTRKPVPSRWWKHPYCWYCGKKVFKSRSPRASNNPDMGTVEHIPPLWITRLPGGEKLEQRKVLACRACNHAEGVKVTRLFPAFFIQLWNGGSLPREKLMLPPGGRSSQ